MKPEAEILLAEIAEAFRTASPVGWTAINVVAPSISEVTGFRARATLDSGEVESFYIEDDEAEERAIDQIERLRHAMAAANDGHGAWYTLALDVASDGTYKAAFDYDSKPDFDFEVSRESFLADLATYPRAEDFYPSWLR